MLVYAKLESARYWIEEENQRRELWRKEQARKRSRKIIAAVAYTACVASPGVAFAVGAFDTVDVPGAIERIGMLFGLAN